MRTTRFVLMALLLACGGDEKKSEAPPSTPATPPVPAEPAQDPAVAQALDLAEAIRANPAGADQVLAAKGMTQAQLDELMFRIAADPKLAEAYEKGQKP